MNEIFAAQLAAQAQPRIFVEWEPFIAGKWAPVPLAKHRVYLGGQMACWDECCHRQICDVSLAPYPVLSVIGPYLKSLQRDHPERLRHDDPSLLERRPPLYFDGSVRGDDLTYVDLDRAYLSIYRRTTLDVKYNGEEAPREGQIPFVDVEQLAQDKLVRNGLLGMLRRKWRRGIDHGEYFTEAIDPRKRRPNLWGLVMDSLEVVMWSARDLGACYVHTDGAIFAHADLAADWIAQLEGRFGLVGTVRAEGPGVVTGLGRFQIGETVAGPTDPATALNPGQRFDNMLQAPKHLGEELTAWLSRTQPARILATNQGGTA